MAITALKHSAVVTPADGNDLPKMAKAIYVGTGGNITLELEDDTGSVLLLAVPQGTVLDLKVRKIHATGTSALNMVAFW